MLPRTQFMRFARILTVMLVNLVVSALAFFVFNRVFEGLHQEYFLPALYMAIGAG